MFKTRAVKRMQDMYICDGYDPNLQWITETNLRALWDYWKSDKFLEKSEKAKANRALVKGGSLHCGGLATTKVHRAWLVKLLLYLI